MKILLILTFIVISFTCQSQEVVLSGGGEFFIDKSSSCLSPEERSTIIAQLKRSPYYKTVVGRDPVKFNFPLKIKDGSPFTGLYGISNFVDHNPTTGPTAFNQYGSSNLDYNCDNRSYDINNGYNHSGTDYFTWPFGWYMYENDIAEVVSVADGTIIDKFDGNFDKNCSCTGNWNAVYIQHDDGTVVWYGHLKKNALTPKAIGDRVVTGEVIGQVASSGCSTGPHLHLEVYNSNFELIDPYAGSCNMTIDSSLWHDQEPYRSSRINAVFTHGAPPEFGCPDSQEDPHFKDVFEREDDLVLAAYYKDQLVGDVTNLTIIAPGQDTINAWSHTSPSTYNASYWYWNLKIPVDAGCGEYQFIVEFNDEKHTHNFYIQDYKPSTVDIDGEIKAVVDSTYTYTTDNNENWLYEWEVTGGNILSGQETPEITVEWKNLDQAKVCLNYLDEEDCIKGEECIAISQFSATTEDRRHNISIAPNPVDDILYINNTPNSDYDIEIIDLTGKRLSSLHGQSKIDVSLMPHGLYIIMIIGDNYHYTQKFVKY